MRLNRFNRRAAVLLLCSTPLAVVASDTSLGESVSQLADSVSRLLSSSKASVVGDQIAVPKQIAVLPAFGEGDAQTLADISIAVHNQLSAKPFQLLKPFRVEDGIARIESQHGAGAVAELPPQQLAEALDVDGVVLVRVDTFEKLYAAAYAHFKIGITVLLYDRQQQQVVWHNRDEVIEREGGVSLNPLGMIATAITSAQALTDSVRLSLIDTLARQITTSIPLPEGDQVERPQLESAFSNAVEGPFRSGQEIQIAVTAEAGLIASFDLLPIRHNLPLQEIEQGRYVGRYVVGPEDGEQTLLARLHLRHPRSRAELDWRVPGTLQIDTVAPPSLDQIAATPVADGVRLSWSYPQQSGGERFLVSRGDPQQGDFQPLDEVAITEYLDRSVERDQRYFYRVQPIDSAGNRGGMATARVITVRPGPTRIESSPQEDITLYPHGSPYIIAGQLSLPRGVTMRALPGSVIQFAEGASLRLLGSLQWLGDERAPIVVEGRDWKIELQHGGKQESLLQHCRISADKRGTLIVNDSTLVVRHCQFQGMSPALDLIGSSELRVEQSRFSNNAIAIRSRDSQLALQQVVLSGNRLAIELQGSQQFQGHELTLRDNQHHLTTERPISLSGRFFEADSYPQLIEKLTGPVTLTWPSDTADNLQQQWLLDQLQQWQPLATRGDWRALATAVQRAREAAGGVIALQDIAIMAALFAGEPLPSSPLSARLRPLYERYRQAPKRYQPWLQQLQLPYRKAYSDSEFLLQQEVLRQAYPAYQQQQGKAKIVDERQAERFRDAISESATLYSGRSGFQLQGWMLHLLDRDLLKSLTTDQQSAANSYRVGIINPHVRHLDLSAELVNDGMQPVPLGEGAIDKALLQRAEKLQLNALLLLSAEFSSTPSRLSDNLHITAVTLKLQLLNPLDGVVLDSVSSYFTQPAFSSRGDREKLLQGAFSKVQPDLIDALRYTLGNR